MRRRRLVPAMIWGFLSLGTKQMRFPFSFGSNTNYKESTILRTTPQRRKQQTNNFMSQDLADRLSPQRPAIEPAWGSATQPASCSNWVQGSLFIPVEKANPGIVFYWSPIALNQPNDFHDVGRWTSSPLGRAYTSLFLACCLLFAGSLLLFFFSRLQKTERRFFGTPLPKRVR